jgi:hypothetical protein
VILTSRSIPLDILAARTGWSIKPEGACKGDICVPLPAGAAAHGSIDAGMLSERLGMPIVRDEATGIECLGPEALGHALMSVQAPEIDLPRLDGTRFRLSSLRGQNVLLLAWASW